MFEEGQCQNIRLTSRCEDMAANYTTRAAVYLSAGDHPTRKPASHQATKCIRFPSGARLRIRMSGGLSARIRPKNVDTIAE